MRASILGPLLALAMALPPSLLAQVPMPPPPPPSPMPRDAAQKTGTARLSGRVTALDTGRPIRRAVVRAAGPELREGKSVSTDADGRWELGEIPAGRFTVSVSKGGYVTLSYGQQRPFEAGKAVDVADGQSVAKLDVALPRGSAITGRVVDEFGEPVANARVSPLRFRVMNGQRRLVTFGTGDTTDDLGQFRLHGLAPGDYYVSAQPSGFNLFGASDDRIGYSQTFYPGVLNAGEATRVPLALGQEAQNILITLSPSRVATLAGTATNSAGKPIPQGIVMLREASPAGAFTVKPAIVRDGAWTIGGVNPGDYVLTLQFMPNLEQVAVSGSSAGLVTAELATEPITVTGDDMRGIALVTSAGGRAKGHLRFEGGPAPASVPSGLAVQAIEDSPMPMMFPGGTVRPDWTFESAGLSGRRMLRVTGLPSGWWVKSITAAGADVTDSGIDFQNGQEVSGIEVLLTRTAAEVSGTAQDAKGAAVADYVVVLFPGESDKWGWQSRYVRVARPDQTGRFVITGLPAGGYLAVALEYLEPGEETDPEFLERLKSLGTTVRVGEGEKKSLTLKVSAQ